ncbi:MAG: FkbM family methyltransferase, partial [Roseovarius sp.]
MPDGETLRPMPETRDLSFTSAGARVQYLLLMALFRVAVTRGLYGRFARALGRLFSAENQALLSIDGAPPFRVPLNDGYWTRFALWNAQYEPEIARVLHAAAGTAELFCDCGANKGYWTVRAAPLFARVVAAEAAGATFAALQATAGQLPNVRLHRVAIHATSGARLTFVNVANSHASARLSGEGGPGGGGPGKGDTTETVETRRIDDLVPEGMPALIKLDVEGAEIDALDGA